MKEMLSCVLTIFGNLFVLITGHIITLRLSVDN